MFPAHIDAFPLYYGSVLIGVLFATFFQGVLTVQVYQYYQNFPEDPRTIKMLVVVLWALSFIHLMLISYTVYFYLVISWGNVQAITHLILPFAFHLLPIAFTILFSQLFFLFRIWILSQRNVLIVGPVFVLSLSTFGLVFAEGMLIILRRRLEQFLFAMIIVGTVLDILIAVLMCYYMRKRTNYQVVLDYRATSRLVTQVIRYTIASTALTSLLVLACLFTHIAIPGSFIYIALYFSSGRTYANAVLANLNARHKLREALESMEPSFAEPVDFGGISTATRGIPRLGTNICEHLPRAPVTTSYSATGASSAKLQLFVQVPPNAYPPISRHSLP
ncbi:hypothetical protein D9756_008729 [Leucocoprinus leucothites]|uniref:DUF6534 domain-containing protein n=1 Tax=Leucocoprinus leucothites TaxID=201217 RepID=A0A8H5D1P4_9AGAR|nr:hypothetical protein D9756_008729 [Leucoagaricus leucothites]